ncbi:hypothetical protein Vadar_030631 [Vaccinium darrowii]|uniref:Uncharacterized protein n=1 Tax=Vaccinium darrowii TaxID=229202 RepID=A0ACB7ZNN0_9ERIC|nr:hypothetical protein Vadar_030631 [Vaccinium darrowii]
MLLPGEKDLVIESSSVNSGAAAFPSDHIKEILDEGSSISVAVAASESEWETMTSYASHLMALPTDQQNTWPFSPDLFRNVYSAIQKAGDQGLSMEEISQVMNMECMQCGSDVDSWENIQELIVEVLKTFGRALKVNAYDSVHVVDSLYRSKYFLTSMANCNQDLEVSIPACTKIDDRHLSPHTENPEDHDANVTKDLSTDSDEVHKVTILNLPEEVYHPSSEMQSSKRSGGCEKAKVISKGNDREGESFGSCSSDFDLCTPILPWVNGDGTINTVVYKGLVRRVLGVVMQNPGMLEDGIINRMNVLNPQSCRSLLKLMIMDNHIIVRKMHETTYGEAPTLLASLLGSRLKKSKMIYGEHYFANPLCGESNPKPISTTHSPNPSTSPPRAKTSHSNHQLFLASSPMDSVVHYALEEICCRGATGLLLQTLWPNLHSPLFSQNLPLCPNVKKALWTNLLNVPGLQFQAKGVSYDSNDPEIQSVEECERLCLKIVAAEHLRNCFVGVYDITASDAAISQPQRPALERLAIARLKDARVVEEFCAKVNKNICKRLGLNNKRYYTRLLAMFSRFGMHKQEENHNRGLAYRVWTSGNFNPEASNIFGSKPENNLNENGASNPPDGDLAYHEKSAQAIPELDLWTSKVDVEDNRKAHDEVIEPELPHGSPSNELLMVNAAAVSNVATVETSPLDLSTPPRQRSYPRYPSLTKTASSARREQWILQRLQRVGGCGDLVILSMVKHWLRSPDAAILYLSSHIAKPPISGIIVVVMLDIDDEKD